ncbi:hypothetical protein [uncultured Gilliamella sp.]|uniref:hypothetical protein n=1 Tax=uncultured Gilliamella sp. TaxID=1193505 RepID=UPI0025F1C6E8|nr:hypothetical protein [uncultured Gilliamella sp.]
MAPWGWICWSTVRKNFWKNEAKVNGSKYSPRNQARMARGLAPKMKIQVYYPRKRKLEIKNEPMEIHHKYLPQRGGSQKTHEIWNLEKATPWGHASMDPYRHTGFNLFKIIKGTNSW